MTERVRATLHRLETDRNVWIATTDQHTARPHLIPLSLAWNGVQVILATPSTSEPGRKELSAVWRITSVNNFGNVAVPQQTLWARRGSNPGPPPCQGGTLTN